jgi:hypothetical protein
MMLPLIIRVWHTFGVKHGREEAVEESWNMTREIEENSQT